MPVYTFINTETGIEEDKFISMADREVYLQENPHIKQKLHPTRKGDSVRLGVTKSDNGFREVLSKVKDAYPRHEIRD